MNAPAILTPAPEEASKPPRLAFLPRCGYFGACEGGPLDGTLLSALSKHYSVVLLVGVDRLGNPQYGVGDYYHAGGAWRWAGWHGVEVQQ